MFSSEIGAEYVPTDEVISVAGSCAALTETADVDTITPARIAHKILFKLITPEFILRAPMNF